MVLSTSSALHSLLAIPSNDSPTAWSLSTIDPSIFHCFFNLHLMSSLVARPTTVWIHTQIKGRIQTQRHGSPVLASRNSHQPLPAVDSGSELPLTTAGPIHGARHQNVSIATPASPRPRKVVNSGRCGKPGPPNSGSSPDVPGK